MRLLTVGVLAAVGMAASSAVVWSATAPRPTRPRQDPVAVLGSAAPALPVRAGAATFIAGRTLVMEGRLGHAALLAERPGTTFLHVSVRPDPTVAATPTVPLELSIVVDRSGSMKGARLANALGAARGMLQNLRDGDTVSVVAYDTRTEVVLAPTRVTSASRFSLERSLERIEARGDTCISCGLEEALNLLGRAGGVGRILLLSDGEATAGVRDVAGFRAIAARARARGIPISSVGIDVDYNERVLSALAQDSNGEHHFAESASDLTKVFQAEFDALVSTIARSAALDVELAPGVEVVRVFDRAFRQEGSRLSVPLGDLTARDERSLLVELRVPRGAVGPRAIADVRLGFDDLGRGGRGQCDGTLRTELVGDAASVSPLDGLVATRIARSATASAILEATELFAGGDLDGAARKLDEHRTAIDDVKARASTSTPSDRRRGLDDDLARQSEALEKAKKNLENVPKPAPGVPPTQSREGKAAPKRNFDFAEPFLK